MTKTYRQIYKVALIGESKSGKSQLCKALTEKDYRFDENDIAETSPIFLTSEYDSIRVQFWESSKISESSDIFYRGVKLVLISVDLSNKNLDFENLFLK